MADSILINKFDELPKRLEVHPLGDNGEVEVLPASSKNLLSSSKLPCGLPPILPDTTTRLKAYLNDPDSLPILHLDAVQRFIPIEPDISSLYSVDICPLQTTLSVKRNMNTGKLLGFVEEIKPVTGGTHKNSTSLCRAPGPPEVGIKGSTGSFPFFPGGMDEPWVELIKKDDLNTAFFEGEMLDTPPGFSKGMKFEKKCFDEIDFVTKQPQKIYLSDVLAMDDMMDFEPYNETEDTNKNEIDLEQEKLENKPTAISEAEENILKIATLPVLNISEIKESEKKSTAKYEWAVVEDVTKPVDNFREKIPKLALEYDFELDVFQKKAVLHLEKKESVFVAAHTSAGKTVVAEYAIALSRKNMARVIYTSPIKALSNQKYRDFKKTFGDVGLITGDVQINPTAFCLIMTTEILRSMLYNGSDAIRELEWVIFDEVHYINDTERGVVWEEVFIMLPAHVNLIMLSATVPNPGYFAEWLGEIKKKKIYVISTSMRPVPLVYNLYTGSVGESQKDIFPIVDSSGRFINNGYDKALKVTSERRSKSKQNTGAKGPRRNVPQSQEKNIYMGLLTYLKQSKLLPAVCFTFSRKKCNAHAEMLNSLDLTDSQEEKFKIKTFFNRSIAKLKDEDKQLPQVRQMREHLLRGFGVHHSGILPIVKEVVEILFQEQLVKVLFATETCAMGVNMPARTVVFDTYRKHDGFEFRDLKPSEFIQMAGRAGRRGLDTTGTVIVLCKGDIPDSISLEKMMTGKPTPLTSQFKLTYNMILNLLKVKTFRVEDVMKRSFGETELEKKRKECKTLLVTATSQLSGLSKPQCSLCDVDLALYMQLERALLDQSQEIMIRKCSQAIANKVLTPGRVVLLSTAKRKNVPGILLSVDRENVCKVLVIAEKQNLSQTKEEAGEEISPWTKDIFYPSEKQPEVTQASFKNILLIANKFFKVDVEGIQKDLKKPETLRYSGHSVSAAFQQLSSFCEANLSGFPSANINIKDIEFVEKNMRLEKLESAMEDHTCIKCPEFSKHYLEMSRYVKLQDEINNYKFIISENSIALHNEYGNRKKVLETLGYIDHDENVQLKGSVAREISNHELLITELLVKSVFGSCEPAQIAALLSCMVFQHKNQDNTLDLPSELLRKVNEIKEVIDEICVQQTRCGINEPHFADQYNFDLVDVVYKWASGTTFAVIMEKTDVDEGIIVRSIQRLSELLKDVRNGATLVGDTVLAKKMEEAINLIKRDIVFAASLYVQ